MISGNFIAYGAATLGVAATLLLAKKRRSGWILSILSTSAFIVYGLSTGIGSFVVVEAVSIFSSLYAWDSWLSARQKKKLAKNYKRRAIGLEHRLKRIKGEK